MRRSISRTMAALNIINIIVLLAISTGQFIWVWWIHQTLPWPDFGHQFLLEVVPWGWWWAVASNWGRVWVIHGLDSWMQGDRRGMHTKSSMTQICRHACQTSTNKIKRNNSKWKQIKMRKNHVKKVKELKATHSAGNRSFKLKVDYISIKWQTILQEHRLVYRPTCNTSRYLPTGNNIYSSVRSTAPCTKLSFWHYLLTKLSPFLNDCCFHHYITITKVGLLYTTYLHKVQEVNLWAFGNCMTLLWPLNISQGHFYQHIMCLYCAPFLGKWLLRITLTYELTMQDLAHVHECIVNFQWHMWANDSLHNLYVVFLPVLISALQWHVTILLPTVILSMHLYIHMYVYMYVIIIIYMYVCTMYKYISTFPWPTWAIISL